MSYKTNIERESKKSAQRGKNEGEQCMKWNSKESKIVWSVDSAGTLTEVFTFFHGNASKKIQGMFSCTHVKLASTYSLTHVSLRVTNFRFDLQWTWRYTKKKWNKCFTDKMFVGVLVCCFFVGGVLVWFGFWVVLFLINQ